MSKWKIKHEKFDDRTPTGKIKRDVSDEQRSIASENQKRLWADPEYRKRQLPKVIKNRTKVFHKNHTPEAKVLIGQKSRETWEKKKGEFVRKFFEKCRSVHSDRYDYSKTEYVNGRTPIIVICKIHGEFQTYPFAHSRGVNCKKCAVEETRIRVREEWSKKKGVSKRNISPEGRKRMLETLKLGVGATRKTLDEVIYKFKEVHGDRYDYSKVEYVNAHAKVIIICKVHGEFEQSPRGHQNGQGCRRCFYENQSKRTMSQ
jgi:hypothetical protein